MSANNGGRNDSVRTSPYELGLRLLFCGTSNDVQVWIQISGRQDHVDVIRVVWKTSRETTRMIYTSLMQCLLKRSIPHEYRHVHVHQLCYLLWIFLDDQKQIIIALQAADQMPSDSPGTADDKMIS